MAYAPPPAPPPPGQRGQWSPAPTVTAPAPLRPPTPEEQHWALMAYLGQFVISGIAPAAVLVGKGRSPFVRAHARQALNMAIGAIVVWLVSLLLLTTVGRDGLALLALGYTAVVMFFLVRSAMAVNRGEFVRVPSFVAWPILK
jgi:uncharacterized protein